MTYAREIHSHGISHIDEEGNMHYDDGRVWNHGVCINSIVSGCHNPVDWQTGGTSYCRKCAAEYDAECEAERKRDQFDRMIADSMSMGLIPRAVANYRERGLYHWQSNALNELRANRDRCAWLQDIPGAGKSEVGIILVHTALRYGVPAAFVDCAGTGFQDVMRQHNTRTALERVKLLVLDDISKMTVTDYAAGELHNVLTARNQAKLRTVVIDEKTGNEFAKMLASKTDGRFGKSVVDRLNWKGGQCVAIAMQGENIRRK